MCEECGDIHHQALRSSPVPDLLVSADILEAARAMVENNQPYQAYLAIRDSQKAIGQWNPPSLTDKQRDKLKIHDDFLKRFPS